MLWRIAWFEIRFWLRSWMLWIFLFVVGLLIFAAIGSDEGRAELNFSNIYRQGPFTIASFYAAFFGPPWSRRYPCWESLLALCWPNTCPGWIATAGRR